MMKNTFCPVVPCPIVPPVPLRYDVYTDAHVHIFIENSYSLGDRFLSHSSRHTQVPVPATILSLFLLILS